MYCVKTCIGELHTYTYPPPPINTTIHVHMWQSRVEIEGYSVVYFDRIAAFEVPYHGTSVKGGAHMRFVDLLDIHASMKRV